MSRSRLAHAAALLIAATAFAPLAGVSATSQAAAADDDLYCYEVTDSNGNTDIQCDEVGKLKAECDLMEMKPGDNEECDDVRRMLIIPMGLTTGPDGSGGPTVGRRTLTPILGLTTPAASTR